MIFLIFVLTHLAHAFEEPAILIDKKIELWKRESCPTPLKCDLPTPLGIHWELHEKIYSPLGLGTFTETKKRFDHEPYRIDIAFYWIQPETPNSSDYLVTQIRLSHNQLGLIAECSQYDDPRQARSIGTGSCSGRDFDRQTGVSLSNLQ